MLQQPRAALLTGFVFAAGFAASATFAEGGAVDSSGSSQPRMSLADNEVFVKPLPSTDNDLPEYPQAMLIHHLPPQAVCVRVSIDEKGRVSATAPIGVGPDCPESANAATAFYEAAQAATKSWHYDPAFLCVFPKKTKASRNGCLGENVKEVPQAVSLVYRFVFEQVNGRGAVRLMN
jgi:hypothetical protein